MKLNYTYLFALILITTTCTINSMDESNSNSSNSDHIGRNKRKRTTNDSLQSKISELKTRVDYQKRDIANLGKENAKLQDQLYKQEKLLEALKEKQEYDYKTFKLMHEILTDLTQKKSLQEASSSQSDNG